MQYKRIIKLNKGLVRGIVKRYVVVSVCSVAGCIAASAQAQNLYSGYQQSGSGIGGAAQAGQEEGITKLLSQINGNISELTNIQTQATTTKVGSLFKKTVEFAPVLNYGSNTSFGAVNGVSLEQLGSSIGPSYYSEAQSSGANASSSKPTFYNLVIDTYCDNIASRQLGKASFMNWLLSSPSLSQGSYGAVGSSATPIPSSLKQYPLCPSYFYKVKKEVDKARNSGGNGFVSAEANGSLNRGALFTAYKAAKTNIFAKDLVPSDYSYHSVSSASLLNALSGKGRSSRSLTSICTSWIQGAVTSSRFKETELPSLSASWALCNISDSIKQQDDSLNNGGQEPALIKGLLKAQLNEAYFNDMKKANATQLSRVIVVNGIINNYLASQRNEKLQEIVKQNNALLVAQAAVLASPTK